MNLHIHHVALKAFWQISSCFPAPFCYSCIWWRGGGEGDKWRI